MRTSKIPDSLSRPTDVFLPTWSRGRPAALDVHVISPLQQQTMGEAASTPGHALQVGVQRKLASHLSACRSVGVEFIPFVMETLGGLAETPSSSFAHWGRPSPRESAPWTRQLKPRSAPNSSSTELLSPCGGRMPSNGFTASQLSLPQRTAVFNSSLFPLLYFLYYIYYNKKEKEKRKKFDGLGLATQTVLYSYLSQASCVIVSGFTAALDLDTYPLRKT